MRRNIQRASNYVLGVVLFAVALFFAGMSTKLTAPGLRKAMLVVGYVIFLGTVVWIATSPISVARLAARLELVARVRFLEGVLQLAPGIQLFELCERRGELVRPGWRWPR